MRNARITYIVKRKKYYLRIFSIHDIFYLYCVSFDAHAYFLRPKKPNLGLGWDII